MTGPGRRRPVLFLLLAFLGLLLLSACSSSGSTGGSTDTASVATLTTPTTAGPAATKPAAPERPLIRADTSQAEIARLNKVYLNCLRDNGVPAAQIQMFSQKQGVDSDTAEKYRKQCGAKQPEGEFDKARESDPDFADHLRANAKCLNQHGIRAEIRKDGDIWLLDDLPPDSKAHWLDDCEQQAFARYYGTLG